MTRKKYTSDDAAQIVYRLLRKQAEKSNARGVSTTPSGGAPGGGGSGGGTPFHNPLDGVGQLIRGGIAGALRKLDHPGIAGRVLTTTLTDVAWSLPATLPTGDEGDIVYFDGSDWVVLPIGSLGQILTVTDVGGGALQPRWNNPIESVVVDGDYVTVGGEYVVVGG